MSRQWSVLTSEESAVMVMMRMIMVVGVSSYQLFSL